MPPKKQSLASGNQVVASNRKARHDYEVLETVEAGMVLRGAEVKSLRHGNIAIRDSYAKVEGGEIWLHGLHIPPYEHAHGFGAVEPDRSRKLLLHKAEIGKLGARAAQEALTLIPLAVYFKDGMAKVELGLAKGRKTHDKRHAIAKRDQEREAARERRWG